jgi:hypothetical protein
VGSATTAVGASAGAAAGTRCPTARTSRRRDDMYIGIGTLLAIILIVILLVVIF